MVNYLPKIVYGDALDQVITLSHPPEGDPFNEGVRADNVTAISGSGVKQVSHNYFEERRKISLTFLSQVETNSLRAFFMLWAGLGKEFQYFESADESAYSTYTMLTETFAPKRLVEDGAGGFICEVDFEFRRVKPEGEIT